MAFDIAKTEGVGTDDLEKSSSLPIIRMLQDQSPEINKRKDNFIEGAEAGDLFFNFTGEVLDSPLKIIPVGSRAVYVEWTPKDQGGGIVATHPLSIITDPRYKKNVIKDNDEWLDDNELKYTRYWCVLAFINEVWEKAIIPMTSTQLRIARDWSKQIAKFKYEKMPEFSPPLFARTWLLSTEVEKNKSGQEYFNFRVKDPIVLDFKKDEDILNLANDAAKVAMEQLPNPKANIKAIEENSSTGEKGVDGEGQPF